MCWDCYDDFYEDKDPFCPKCDQELQSDSEDESISSKPKTSITSAQQKTPPSLTKQISSQNTSNTTNNTEKTATTTATASINSTNFNYNDLAKVRVIKKNLVYVIGLSPEIANEETLLKKEYFSQYGKVTKIVVNTNNAYNPKGPNGPSYSAYLTFSNEREASMAILGTEEFQINDRIIRASYGTTKYCSYFLKQQECPNLPDCLYLHSFGKDKEFFSKDETISNKNIFIDQQKLAIKNIQKYTAELIKIKNTALNYVPVLPSPQKIIEKLIEQDVLDIKQKPADTPSSKHLFLLIYKNNSPFLLLKDDKKEDKKKKEDNTPFIDQWGMDFSIPTPPPNKKEESPSQFETRKQSQSLSIEKDLYLSQPLKTTSPILSKSISTQQEPTLAALQQKNKQESEKGNYNKGSSTTQEEYINFKEDQFMKHQNQASNNPSASQKNSRSISDTSFLTQEDSLKQPNKIQQSIQELPTYDQQSEQSIPTNKTQSGIQNATQANLTTNKTQNQSTEQSKKQTNKNTFDKSPNKDQSLKGNNDEQKKEDQTDTKKKSQNQMSNTNQTSEVTSAEHSRTSSINQKNSIQPSQASATTITSQSNGPVTANNKSNTNPSNQNGNYYEKKDGSKKEDSKFQKHQYIPVNQANKQINQTVEAQKDNQNQQLQKEESKLTKSQSVNTQKNRLSQQQTATINNLLSQNPQTSSNTQSQEINDENTNSQQLNLQITQNQTNPHLQQLLSNDESADNNQFKTYAVYESVSPKYKLQKVQKLEKTLSSDNEIMKRLLIRTSQKNSQSRFDFAKNSENSHQPVEDIDVINNIFNGQYIILTKSQSTKQICNKSFKFEIIKNTALLLNIF